MKKRFYINNLKQTYIDIELKEDNEGRPVYTSSGNMRGYGCGQILDGIVEKYPSSLVKMLHGLWVRNHLNDMNAGCQHQRDMLLGNDKIILKKYILKSQYTNQKQQIKDKIMQNIQKDGITNIDKESQFILNLKFSLNDIEIELNEDILQYYDLVKTEVKSSGWVNYSTFTPSGVLGKACPVCGYKYGTGWQYRAINNDDLLLIKSLLL